MLAISAKLNTLPQDCLCKNGTICVTYDAQCDGVTDCPDGRDEEFCKSNGLLQVVSADYTYLIS